MLDAILNRRTTRSFTKEEVKKEDMEMLLKAAMSAPSGLDARMWHFIVINKREIIEKIIDFHPFPSGLKTSSNAIAVCADMDLERREGLWIQDLSAATQNILIAAEDIGLGAVWMSIYPEDDRVLNMQKLLGIPENVVPFSLVSIGCPNEDKKNTERFMPDRIHYNKW